MKKLIVFIALVIIVTFVGCSPKPANSNPSAEDKAYIKIKERTNLPVYKPKDTAGYSFSPTSPDGKTISGEGDRIWYKKGNSYFQIVNALVGDIGDIKTEEIGVVNGKRAVITSNGLIALWNERHNDMYYYYGIELSNSDLPKEEVVKIIKSMKLVPDKPVKKDVLNNHPDKIIIFLNNKQIVVKKDSKSYERITSELVSQLNSETLSAAQCAITNEDLEKAGSSAIHFKFPRDTFISLRHAPADKLEITQIVIPLAEFRNNVILHSPDSRLTPIYGPVKIDNIEQIYMNIINRKE